MSNTSHARRLLLGVVGAATLAVSLAACGGAPGGEATTGGEETSAAEETAEETGATEEESTDTGAVEGVATAEVGDCVNTADMSGSVSEIPVVDCTEEHDSQVVGKFALEDGDFPGDDAISAEAEAGCLDLFAEFIGITYEESSLSMNYLGPSEETWAVGDREVICFAISSEPVTESWEDAAI